MATDDEDDTTPVKPVVLLPIKRSDLGDVKLIIHQARVIADQLEVCVEHFRRAAAELEVAIERYEPKEEG